MNFSSRYYDAKLKKTVDGREVYSSRVYPNIPLRDDDIYVATELGDRLDTLANYFYDDSSLWWIISTANNDIPQSSLYLPEGVQIRIPADVTIAINNFEAINS